MEQNKCPYAKSNKAGEWCEQTCHSCDLAENYEKCYAYNDYLERIINGIT